jgi:hypothetical protein
MSKLIASLRRRLDAPESTDRLAATASENQLMGSMAQYYLCAFSLVF